MPNHVHAILSFVKTTQSINSIIGNGKRFMAYEIIKRLEKKEELQLLSTLQNDIEEKRKANNKLHNVWELSFDWKECNSRKFIDQKLDYIHSNPCRGKWNLCNSAAEYNRSSARYYMEGVHASYRVKNIMEMEDVDLGERRIPVSHDATSSAAHRPGERRCWEKGFIDLDGMEAKQAVNKLKFKEITKAKDEVLRTDKSLEPDDKSESEGDFLDENGNLIGNDGKLYVIKTSKTSFDSGAPSNGITVAAATGTVQFIKDNSGDTKMFRNNDLAYSNSIEILGDLQQRKQMFDEVNRDDGKGGTAPHNNQEYGGRITRLKIVTRDKPGPIADPTSTIDATIAINLMGNGDTDYHSHQSGTKNGKGFVQAPSYGKSNTDIESSGSETRYGFGRRDGTVYMYNNTGVLATLPHANFLFPNGSFNFQ